MKKKDSSTRIIIITISGTLLAIILFIAMSIYAFLYMPRITYNETDFLENKSNYQMIATLCYNDYQKMCKDNADTKYICYEPERGSENYLSCLSDNHHLYLNDEECKAIDKIRDTFRLDKKFLDTIRVQDNFVSFCIVNGRASYIYSVNDEKPTFINRDDDKEKKDYNDIVVSKITDHWYFACH